MSRMPFRGAGPVGSSAGVHHWAALPSGVKVSDDEVNTAERGSSHANHQNENVPGTHTRSFRSQIGRTCVRGMVGGASSTRNQSSDECGRLILGYCTRGLSVVAPPSGGVVRMESGTDAGWLVPIFSALEAFAAGIVAVATRFAAGASLHANMP